MLTMNGLKTMLARSLMAVCLLAGIQQATASTDVMTEGVKPGKWTMDLDAAQAYAKEHQLPLFVNFTGSDWCGWCKLMDKSVFSKEEWASFAADHLVLVTIDFPEDESIVPEKFKERNQKLQKEFGVEGYPTFLILSPEDMSVEGKLGAGQDKTPESFSQEIMEVLKYTDAQVSKFTAKLTPEKAATYKAALETLHKTEKDLQAWLANGPDKSEENLKAFMNFQKTLGDAKKALRQVEVDYQASQLTDEVAKQYLEAYKSLVEAESELDAWLSTMPKNNEANMKKFQDMQEAIQKLKAQVSGFEVASDK